MGEQKQPKVLIIETSGRNGHVALAGGPTMVEHRPLDQNRRNGRDLAPTVAALLEAGQWQPQDIDLVLVSRGPGSYTGLRVGVISAKVFAFASGAALLGIETFAAIASQSPPEIHRVDVVADAQQERIYVQSFLRSEGSWQATTTLAVRPFADWLANRHADGYMTGPGLVKWQAKLPPGVSCLSPETWDPQPASLLQIGLLRWQMGDRDDVKTLEPLYCRPSSAEEQWQALGR